MGKKIKQENINLRFNVLSLIAYLVGIVLVVQLFNLQIVHGAEYREQSNTRLSRESKLQAARGEILDSSGNTLATTKMGFSLELYKTKNSNEELNNVILKIVNLLEANNDKYINNFPIGIVPILFSAEPERISPDIKNLLFHKVRQKNLAEHSTLARLGFEFI